MRVGRTLGLGQNVLDAGRLEDGAHSTTGLYTGTGSCGLHENAGTTEFRLLLVRDGRVDDGNLHEILLRILDTLGDGGGDFVSLTETIANNAVLVSDDNDRRETEVTTTFGDLGHSLNGDKSVLEFKVRGLYSLNICICHSLSIRI